MQRNRMRGERDAGDERAHLVGQPERVPSCATPGTSRSRPGTRTPGWCRSAPSAEPARTLQHEGDATSPVAHNRTSHAMAPPWRCAKASINTSSAMAMMSCSSRTLMITSPTCRWCSAVVGSSLSPMMVLENIIAAPMSRLRSPKPKPSTRGQCRLREDGAADTVTSVASRSMRTSFCGCRFSPSRYSRKMMPTCPIPRWSRVAEISANP